MILVGVHHWSEKLPVWDLLKGLAGDRPMAASIYLVDSIEEATKLVASDL